MNFFYTRLFVLSAMLLPVLAGCQSYAQPLGGTNSTIPVAKQGQDCRVHVFGIGAGLISAVFRRCARPGLLNYEVPSIARTPLQAWVVSA